MHPVTLPLDRPILIAGPTASGKSALALALAARQGRAVVNADALQVFAAWRVLTARPSAADECQVHHRLYGHVETAQPYSVGHWLREISPLLRNRPAPVVVGGTGLYFRALTEGLAEIPDTPPEIRREADAADPADLLSALDRATRERIDRANPARIRRAWEVLRSTGRGLAAWQDSTPSPPLPLDRAVPLVLQAPVEWLTPRIERRFDAMLDQGVLDEVAASLSTWDPARPSARAIGAAALIAYLRGDTSLAEARERAIVATRQYAKRQRTWFRARMGGWRSLTPAEATALIARLQTDA